MKSLFAVAFLLQLTIQGQSQGVSLPGKPSLDTSVLGKWPELSGGALTPNGKYLAYILQEHIPTDQITTVVQSQDGKWKKELKGIKGVQFSADSRNAFYLSNDTLYAIGLGYAQVLSISGVKSFSLVPRKGGEWLVYQLKAPEKILIVQDEKTKKEIRFSQVESYYFSKGGEAVALESKVKGEKEEKITWVDLKGGKENTVWQGAAKPLQFVFDDNDSQLAFTTESNGQRGIWYYKQGNSSSEQVLSDGDAQIDSGLYIGSLDRFSKDGQRVFFNLEKRYPIHLLQTSAANINVWRYNDNMLQAEQLQRLVGKKEIVKNLLSIIRLDNKKLYQLQENYSVLIDQSENYTLINKLDTDQDLDIGQGEGDWNPVKTNSMLYLASNIDGSRKQLPWAYGEIYDPKFSPEGKFIIYRPYSMLHYFSYEVATGTIRNITFKIDEDLTLDMCYKNNPIEHQKLLDIPGWLKGDSGVLIYGHNDIWLADPLAKRPPECITNNYGKKHGVIFRLWLREYRKNPIFSGGQKLILAAFNKKTKENGNFSKVLGRNGDPRLINMELPLYSVHPKWGSSGGNIQVTSPAKATNGSAYLVQRETASNFPNFYYTSDLKHFQQVTFLTPEKKFNWLTTELHSWIAPDGDTLQGVLFMPENFDPSKKYPVLFSIYRQFSDEVNWYQDPKWTTDRINVPWFVSNGYLVFTPDIHYTIPKFKQSVVNCVSSAAEYISKLPFVDSMRLGIQGHSVGGYEMGYIVTNENKFAAISSAAGFYDKISESGTILPPPYAMVRSYDYPLWDKKDWYIEQSSIFDVDKAKTPLLMVAGEKDEVVPYDQNIEFFLGLRRLGKPAWMLTYEEEGHVINRTKNYKDYTIRITQFFDHYLKGKLAPVWMTKGIPARLKGAESGYELDNTMCMKGCKVCQKLNTLTDKQ